ncbi:hypothetical protein IV203_018589 [Nitzschia inconspicua]|uniref:Uncharacterized protein n=1 Tax=Nitzschia inconspicua TaxID=303405 RepID=A0A9K3Q6H8_9STRA|nr:hypothetical protein IV203_018589 [Nitzschia inconspicua]
MIHNNHTVKSNPQSTLRSRIRQRCGTGKLGSHGISTAVCLVAFLSIFCIPALPFQPHHRHRGHRSVGTSSISSPSYLIPSSSSKRSSQHYFALDYRDISTTSKSSRLSLSSIAVPASSVSSLVNDGSDHYSWLSSGWERAMNNKNSSIYSPTNKQQRTSPMRSLSQSQEYQRRKEEWAKRYTTLNGLRRAFGSNRNKLWGDLDPTTARKLYKSLLPNALCELVLELGVEPEELAPLAYQARKAAKLYARERCQVPARIAASLFDGFRQWRRYGRFQPDGMSYEQLWDKYYHQQLEQVGSQLHEFRNSDASNDEDNLYLDDTVTEEEIISQTCQKILEKACTTNEMVDRMVLHNKRKHDREDSARQHRNDLLLKRISRTLQRDVRKLLDPSRLESDNNDFKAHRRSMTPQEYHALKLFALSQKQAEAEELVESR